MKRSLLYSTATFLTLLLTACQAEIWVPANEEILNRNNTSAIYISCDDLLPVNPFQTKADPLQTVLSTVNDINIKVHMKDGSRKHIYCNADSLMIGNNLITPTMKSGYIDNFTMSNFANSNSVKIHLENFKYNEVLKVEAIANAGHYLHQKNIDWATVKESGEFNKQKGYCLMYGWADKAMDNPHGKQQCKIFNLNLKRSRALLSIEMHNAGLKEGVTITPTKVRLCNVPESCTITALHPDVGNRITVPDERVLVSQERIVVAGSLSGGGKGVTEDVRPTVGMHDRPYYMFYIYENAQGKSSTPNSEHRTKYPDGISSVSDAKDPALNFKCTYVEIEADYVVRDLVTGQVRIGGVAVYRFFLGEDAVQDFNVLGNHYYKLNLNLRGFGGASEDGRLDADGNISIDNSFDLSWRIDLSTQDWGFQKNQFDFDGHLVDGIVPLIGDRWKFTKVLKGDGNSSWLMLNVKNYGGLEWANPTAIVDTDNVELKVVNGGLKFVVQPMYYGEEGIDPAGAFTLTTYKEKVNYREMLLEVTNLDDPSKVDTVTVRQYAPIPFKTASGEILFMERFEEYTDGVYGFPWAYEGDDLSTGLYDVNGTPGQIYNFGNPAKDPVGMNTSYLVPKVIPSWPSDITYQGAAKGCAAHVCYIKGTNGGLPQGSNADYYALPSESMMRAMFERALEYNEAWGPFEPVHYFQDYWTSTVPQDAPTTTAYYDSSIKEFKTTAARNSLKRVRTVYTLNYIVVNETADWR